MILSRYEIHYKMFQFQTSPWTVRNFLRDHREDIPATAARDNAGCELLQNLHNSSQKEASWGLGIPYMFRRRETHAPAGVHAHPLNRLFPMVRAQMGVLERRFER
jgi:hypothetical protein